MLDSSPTIRDALRMRFMSRFRRLALGALSMLGGLASSGCGGDSNPLVATVSQTATLADAAEVNSYYAVLVPDSASAEFVWSGFDGGGGAMLKRRISTDLEIGAREILAGPQATRTNAFPAACRSARGMLASWSDRLAFERFPSGITLDASNIVVQLPDSQRFRPHENVIGEQDFPYVACLSDGRYAVSWRNICTATERRGGTRISFRPAECDQEPDTGIYLRIFDAAGQPVSPVYTLFEGPVFGGAPMAALDNGNFVLVIRDRLQIRNGDGELVEVLDPAPVWSERSSVSCHGSKCLSVAGADPAIFDARELSSIRTLLVRETESPAPNTSIGPSNATAACDDGGSCLAIWVLESTVIDEDVVETEFLGIYARPFRLSDGTLGEEIFIQDTEPTLSALFIASTGAGAFLAATSDRRGLTLHSIDVR